MTGDGEGRFAFLCDFDGTVCPTKMMDFLYQLFAACGMEFAERWGRGEISTQDEIESTFDTVSASREEMEATLDTIEIDHVYETINMRKRLRALEDEVAQWKNQELRS